jgi:hypothetical protein
MARAAHRLPSRTVLPASTLLEASRVPPGLMVLLNLDKLANSVLLRMLKDACQLDGNEEKTT